MASLVTDSERKTPVRHASSAILSLQSDKRLVELVRSGHDRAFEAIVHRYRKPLVRFALGFLPESRAEDAVQQAFINAHAALLASGETVQLKPWLYAITRNAALNMLRQNGWTYEQIPADFDGVQRPDQVVEQRIELEATVAAVNGLPERQRDALVMRELEGRSYDEIALALGTGDGAVRQLLNRARVTLRNAASVLVPPPLVARAASSLPPSDGRRAAEVLGGLGAASIAKAGATAVVAGSLVVGAVNVPLHSSTRHKITPSQATVSAKAEPAAKTAAAAAAANASVSLGVAHRSTSGHSPGSNGRHSSGESRSGSSNSGSGHNRGSDDGQRSGSDDSIRERSGSGDTTTRTRSGSDDGTSRSGSGSSGSSGPSGSDNAVATVAEPGNDSLSGTSGSGTSGSVTSGSGTSGSGSSGSGSGSDDHVATGTVTTEIEH